MQLKPLLIAISVGLNPGWGANAAAAAAAAKRPNVVLVIADDFRADWMGHKGATFMQTPNLDSLAAEGISFDNAFACSGVCSPSRASILTGRYAHRASAPEIVWRNNSFLLTQTPFPRLLHDAGYATGYIGKFHLGQDEVPQPGFDYWAGFPFVGNHSNQPIWINGKLTPQTGFTDDRIAELAAQWIEAQGRSDKPFLLIVGLKSPHIPFQFPERMKSRLQDTVFAEPENYALRKTGLASNAIFAAKFPPAIPAYGNFQEWVRSYSRLAFTLDESVGTIVQALQKTSVLDDTFFVFTSDQGYSLGEFGLCEKHYAYEQVMRIPMIVRYPSWIPAGTRKQEMALTLDLAPTLLDVCGVAAPKDIDGRSWKPLFLSERPAWREDFFFDFWHYFGELALPTMQAVRTERFKLIEYQYSHLKELYDLKTDPHEKNNLYGEPGMATVRADMETRLDRLKQETGWQPRQIQMLDTLQVLGPVTKEADTALRATLAGEVRLDPVKAGGQTFAWRRVSADDKQSFDLGAFAPGEIFYVAVPLERLTDFDPYVTLEFFEAGDAHKPSKRNFPMAALYGADVIWMNRAYAQATGVPYHPLGDFNDRCNYPLPGKTNMALFRCLAPARLPRVQAEIIAPENAVRVGADLNASRDVSGTSSTTK